MNETRIEQKERDQDKSHFNIKNKKKNFHKQ